MPGICFQPPTISRKPTFFTRSHNFEFLLLHVELFSDPIIFFGRKACITNDKCIIHRTFGKRHRIHRETSSTEPGSGWHRPRGADFLGRSGRGVAPQAAHAGDTQRCCTPWLGREREGGRRWRVGAGCERRFSSTASLQCFISFICKMRGLTAPISSVVVRIERIAARECMWSKAEDIPWLQWMPRGAPRTLVPPSRTSLQLPGVCVQK